MLQNNEHLLKMIVFGELGQPGAPGEKGQKGDLGLAGERGMVGAPGQPGNRLLTFTHLSSQYCRSTSLPDCMYFCLQVSQA